MVDSSATTGLDLPNHMTCQLRYDQGHPADPSSLREPLTFKGFHAFVVNVSSNLVVLPQDFRFVDSKRFGGVSSNSQFPLPILSVRLSLPYTPSLDSSMNLKSTHCFM
uniref:Uncharacterized protein n=1 Tax=Nelumbo nucifera TaxID=4432 RepID=A0A822YJY6_NELNU|nr:TPA_asm: hypothetical protein HUJ06_011284 [Nelumbo nucifera]